MDKETITPDNQISGSPTDESPVENIRDSPDSEGWQPKVSK